MEELCIDIFYLVLYTLVNTNEKYITIELL